MHSFLTGSRLWTFGIAVSACLLAVLITGILLWRLGTQEKDYSLASRLPALHTLLYIRTHDRTVIEKAIQMFGETERDLPQSIPAPEGLYEFAVLLSGGSPKTILWVREDIGSTKVFFEKGSASKELFLPEDQHHLSLAESKDFQGLVKRDTTNIAWIDPALLTLHDPNASPLLLSLLSGTEHLLLEFGTMPRKLYLFGPDFRGTKDTSFPIPSSLSGTLLDITIGNPKKIFSEMARVLEEEDEALFVGLKGIVQSYFETHAGRTDVENVTTEFFTTPVRLLVREQSGKRSFFLMGAAKNKGVIQEWIQSMEEFSSEGTIRHLKFFEENERTDVILHPESKRREIQGMNGWVIVELGGRESPGSRVIAYQDKKFVIGNDAELLQSELPHLPARSPLGIPGSVHLPWLRTELSTALPFITSSSLELLQILMPSSKNQLEWTLFPHSNRVEIEWMLR